MIALEVSFSIIRTFDDLLPVHGEHPPDSTMTLKSSLYARRPKADINVLFSGFNATFPGDVLGIQTQRARSFDERAGAHRW